MGFNVIIIHKSVQLLCVVLYTAAIHDFIFLRSLPMLMQGTSNNITESRKYTKKDMAIGRRLVWKKGFSGRWRGEGG